MTLFLSCSFVNSELKGQYMYKSHTKNVLFRFALAVGFF